MVNFVFSHEGHFGQGGWGQPPSPVVYSHSNTSLPPSPPTATPQPMALACNSAPARHYLSHQVRRVLKEAEEGRQQEGAHREEQQPLGPKRPSLFEDCRVGHFADQLALLCSDGRGHKVFTGVNRGSAGQNWPQGERLPGACPALLWY